MTAPTVDAPTSPGLAGKYLSFMLGREYYGVPVLKVREIIRLCDITRVPQMPDYLKGVINLRGKIIPVADLRVKFRLTSTENTELTCIIVMQVAAADGAQSLMGVIVDAVEEVANITAAEIEPPPDFGGAWQADYIVGMARSKAGVKALLDMDRLVAPGSLQQFVPAQRNH